MEKEFYVYHHGNPKKGITFRIDSGEEERLRDKCKENLRAFSVEDITFERFVQPSDIVSYRCDKCEKDYADKPTVRVSIHDKDEIMAGYRCAVCNNVVYLTSLRSAEGVPVELIGIDKTGEYKRPTSKTIEDLLDKMDSIAAKGHSFDESLRIAETWAKIISYSLPADRIKQMHGKRKEVHIEYIRGALPDILEEINARNDAFSLEVDEAEMVPYKGTLLQRDMDLLFELIEDGRLPENLPGQSRKDILRALHRHQDMFMKERRALEEQKRKLEESLVRTEASIDNSRKLRHRYESLANITADERIEVTDEILFPDGNTVP